MTSRQKQTLFILLLVGIALNLLTLILWNPAYIANDGIQYISTAANWLFGKGFSTNALIYGPHFQGVLPAAQTVWPPGYPFAIAITSRLGFDLETTVLILNLIMHVAAAAVMWRIFLKMGVERFYATVCAFIFYVMAIPWSYVSSGLTEPLFTTLLLLGMLFLPVPNKGNILHWVICGLFLAASIFVRYSSVFAAFGTGAGIFIYLILYERRSIAALVKPCIKLTMLIALPTIVFGYLMYRTSILIGTLDRYSGSKVPETLGSTARRWLAKFSELLGFSVSETSNNGWLAIFWFLVFCLIILAIVFCFLFGDRNYLRSSYRSPSNALTKPPTRPDRTEYLRVFTLVTFFHSLALFAYLTINSVQSSPLEIITRYLYQIYPSIYAAFCYMLFSLFEQFNSGKKQIFLKTSTSALIVLYLFAQINSVWVTRPSYFRDSLETTELMELQVNDSVSVKNFIKRCFADGKLGKTLWSPHAQPIHLHTGVPTISQSHNYTDKPFNAEEFQDRVMQYQTGMFIFVNFLNSPNENHENYMSSAKTWLINNHFYPVELQSNTFGMNRTVAIYSADPDCDAS